MKYLARAAIFCFAVIGASAATYPWVRDVATAAELAACQLAVGLTTITCLLIAGWQRRRK